MAGEKERRVSYLNEAVRKAMAEDGFMHVSSIHGLERIASRVGKLDEHGSPEVMMRIYHDGVEYVAEFYMNFGRTIAKY